MITDTSDKRLNIKTRNSCAHPLKSFIQQAPVLPFLSSKTHILVSHEQRVYSHICEEQNKSSKYKGEDKCSKSEKAWGLHSSPFWTLPLSWKEWTKKLSELWTESRSKSKAECPPPHHHHYHHHPLYSVSPHVWSCSLHHYPLFTHQVKYHLPNRK